MFTGLVADIGRVMRVEHGDDGARLEVWSEIAGQLKPGDSIAVNGVCLTAAEVDAKSFVVEVMNESLARTSLGGVEERPDVNLELALRATDRLGGHIVQGHVDGTGTIAATEPDGFARRVRIATEPELLRYVVEKGSITVDGVSLTVAEADRASFTVSLIPETLERTTLGVAEPGDKVNLEVDVVAKYVEKLVVR